MLKPCHALLLWALLAGWAFHIQAQQTPAPPTDVCLSPKAQLVSLCRLYAALNGRDWTNQDGWDACPGLLSKPYPEWNATTGTCFMMTDGGSASAQQAAQQDPSSVMAAVPDACCWYGVSCCKRETCQSLDDPLACSCSPGLVVGLRLAANNMKGMLSGYANLTYLSCSLRSVQLSNNHIRGSLPGFLTTFSQLKSLGLSYNNITGSIPEEIGQALTSLRVLDLSYNNISGTVPQSICGPPNTTQASPLTDILVANNWLTGVMDITRCSNLIMLDATNNDLSGVLADGSYPQLHIILLENNLIDSVYVYLTRVMTELNLASNSFKGTLPLDLNTQFFLTSLNLKRNDFNGTIPSALFNNLGALSVLDLSGNKITGSVPNSLGKASSLRSLDLSSTHLTGKLPESILGLLSVNGSFLDIRNTYMSCCGSNFTLYPNSTGRYATIDYSLPRLPKGLTFSTIVQPLTDLEQHPDEMTNLFCPFIQADPAFQPSETSVRRQSSLLVTWFLDPEYTLYENCKCGRGSVLVNDTDLQLVYCTPTAPTSKTQTWVWIIVAVLGAVVLLALILYMLFFRGTRPILVQNFLDMRKRLKGAPQGGLVSIVVTDIEGFSGLMQEFPELTAKALLLHNNLIRKAMWTNFGNTIEQEGGSFAIVFHEAQDAVRFSLQVQLLLANQSWPPGLLDAKQESGDSLRRKVLNPSSKRKRSHLLRHFYRGSQHGSSGSRGSPEDNNQASERSERPSPAKSGIGVAPAAFLANRLEGLSHMFTGRSMAAAVPGLPVNGLRVRMGIATGDMPPNSVLAGCHVMELAHSVSRAAAGGQILMCSGTFQAVRTMARELGCVDVNGFCQQKLNNNQVQWMLFWRLKEQQPEEATFLHMGEFLSCTPGTAPPVVLAAQLTQLNRLHGSKRYAASPEHHQPAAGSSLPCSQHSVRLYQVLAPSLVSRGRFFGSNLSMKEQWIALDVPYFSAPGAALAPLTPSDVVPSYLGLPLVTMVFCMVDGGKSYAARSRRDAEVVHAQLVALMKSVLRQVPGGYFVKGQDGDLKYMVAFADPKGALSWCLAVQECAMYVDWPASALQQWPEEQDGGKQLLFRGPRLKLGACEGTPRSILPDYNGRADYLGDSVNQAARIMDAAAHGGQVAFKAELAQQLLRNASDSLSRAPSCTPEPACLHEPSSAPPDAAPQLPRAPSRLGAAAGGTKERVLARSMRRLRSGLHGVGQLGTHREQGGGDTRPVVIAAVADRPVTTSPAGEMVQEGGQQQQQQEIHGVQHGQQPLAAGQPEHASAGPWVVAGVQGAPQTSHGLSEVLAFHLGSFRFKGSDEVIPIAHITQASLAARRFPTDPPRGKGARLSEARGVLARAHMSFLDSIVDEYASQGSCASLQPPSPATRLSSMVHLRRGFGSMLRQPSSTVQRRAAGGHVEEQPSREKSNLRPTFRHVHSSRT